MNRTGRAALVLCLGAVTARLIWSGGFGWFVQQRMRWPLILAAVALLIFGVYEALSSVEQESQDASSRKRSAGPAVGWMLILPLLVLIAVEPTGLGAAAADRVDAFTPTETDDEFEPIIGAENGPVEMRVFEFLDRAIWDDDKSLDGVVIRLEGLVVNDDEVDDGFKLTRFSVSCCAADGLPMQVTLHDVGRAYADDAWVVADVVWREPDVPYLDQDGPLRVEATAISVLELPEAPNDPYESPY